MKIYKLNSLTTLFFMILIIGFVVFAPIFIIQLVWNSTVAKTYSDITIDFWQSLILWLIVLVVLNILGFFKFEFAIESGDGLDKELIKKKIHEIKDKAEKDPDSEKNQK